MLNVRFEAATHIMNDDLQAAEDGLASGNTAFHKVGTFTSCALMPRAD